MYTYTRRALFLTACIWSMSIMGMIVRRGTHESHASVCARSVIEQDMMLLEEGDDIWNAVNEGDLTTLKNIVSHDNVNTYENHASRDTLLHVASKHNYTEIMRVLLDQGAGIDGKNAEGATPLCDAATFGCYEAVNLLLDYKAHVHKDALAFACKCGHEGIVDVLLNHGIDSPEYSMSIPGVPILPPLIFAVYKGHTSIIEKLIDHGTDIEEKDNVGLTPLVYAVYYSYAPIVELLLQHGAKIVYFYNNGMKTMSTLNVAAQFGYTNIFEMLLAYNAQTDIDLQYLIDKNHTFPLHVASHAGHDTILNRLLGFPISVDKKFTQLTPLHIALQVEHPEIARELIAAGASLTAESADDNRPIDIQGGLHHELNHIIMPIIRENQINANVISQTPYARQLSYARMAYGQGCHEAARIIMNFIKDRDISAQAMIYALTWHNHNASDHNQNKHHNWIQTYETEHNLDSEVVCKNLGTLIRNNAISPRRACKVIRYYGHKAAAYRHDDGSTLLHDITRAYRLYGLEHAVILLHQYGLSLDHQDISNNQHQTPADMTDGMELLSYRDDDNYPEYTPYDIHIAQHNGSVAIFLSKKWAQARMKARMLQSTQKKNAATAPDSCIKQ